MSLTEGPNDYPGEPPRLVKTRTGVLKVVLGSGGGRAFGLVAALAAAYLLGPEQFGVLGFAQATAVMISSFGGLALPALVTREVAQNIDDDAAITRSALKVAWLTTALVCFLLIGATLLGIGNQLPEESRDNIPLLLAATVVSAGAQTTNGILLGRHLGLAELSAWSSYTAVRAASVGLGIVVLALTGSGTLAMAGAAIGEAGVAAVNYWRLRRQPISQEPSNALKGLRMLKLSVAPALAEQSYQGAYWLGQFWLVAQPNGLVLVGWFSLANRLVQGASFLPQSFTNSYAADLHRAATAHAGMRPIFVRTARQMTLAALAVTVAMSVAAPILGMLDSQYEGAVRTIQVLSLSLILIGWNSLMGDLALATHHTFGWAVSDLVLALVFVGAAFLLIPGWGPVGLAVASNLSLAASIVFLAIYVAVRGNAAPREEPD